MKNIEETKKIYDAIEIPDNLDNVVREAVKMGEEKYKPLKIKRFTAVKGMAAAAAAAVCLLLTGLNTSEAFAKSMGNIPVIGGVMQMLTIRSYESSEQRNNVNTTISKPEIVVEDITNADVADKADRVNEEINKRVDAYITDANKRIEEYKEAFLSTGGTVEEWNERGIDFGVSYEVKANTEDVLSFVITCFESSFAFSSEQIFYNLNLKDGTDITLEDMFGDDYNTLIAEEVLKQCEERANADENLIYWSVSDDMGIFKTEDLYDPDFYINESGNVVIVYPKYVVGPGYMGIQEFEINQK